MLNVSFYTQMSEVLSSNDSGGSDEMFMAVEVCGVFDPEGDAALDKGQAWNKTGSFVVWIYFSADE